MDYTDFGIEPLSGGDYSGGGGGGYAEPLQQPSMDWGASSPLSGSGGLFGGGGGMFDFGGGGGFGQDDNLITTTAMNAGSPADGPVPQAQEEPSFFKKLFSGAIMGLGMGGGGDDFASGFSKGYQGVIQMREMERQRMQQEQEMKMKQQMQSAQLAQLHTQQLMNEKQLSYMDSDHQMAVEKGKQDILNGYVQDFGQPMEIRDTSPDDLKMLYDKYGPDMVVKPYDGKFYVFDPNKTLANDVNKTHPLTGATKTFYANQDSTMTMDKWDTEETSFWHQQQLNQQKIAGEKDVARINASRPQFGPSWAQPGNVPEQAQYQIRAIESDISRAKSDLTAAQEDFPGLMQDQSGKWQPPQGRESYSIAVAAANKANQAQQLINQKTQQRDTLISSFGGQQQGGGAAFTSTKKLSAADAKAQGFKQEKFNSQTGQWEYR